MTKVKEQGTASPPTGEESRDSSLQIRVTSKDKRDFQAACAAKELNPSDVLREHMAKWVKNAKK